MHLPVYFPYTGYPVLLSYPYHPNFQHLQYSHLSSVPVYAGKTYRYDYEDGNVFIIHFFDPTHRHDQGIAGPHTGFNGYYTFNYVEIAPRVYFMYWLEEVYTVSQVADFNRMLVYTHYTYDDKGVRKSLFHSGTITELDSVPS